MKLLASAAFGVVALATAIFSATPAEARSSVGIYVGGPGHYDGYRSRCDNYWYRRRHPRRCAYYYDYDDDYYPSYYYYDDYYYRPSFGFRFYGDRGHRRHWGKHHRRHHGRHHRRHRHH